MFGRKKKRQPDPAEIEVARKDSLTRVVVKNPEVEAGSAGEYVELRYPTVVTPWFSGMAKRMGIWDGTPLLKRLQLDAMGTQVWKWIDDKTTVQELISLLSNTYSLHEREAELSMAAFLRELGKRGIIAFR